MKWINSSIQFDEAVDASALIKKVERACRTCYRSEDKIADGTAERLIRSCIGRGHESVLEHSSITFRVICDRAVAMEWTRHRIASYSIESTRYCNYSKEKFNNELTFIKPTWWEDVEIPSVQQLALMNGCRYIEDQYMCMMRNGAKAEDARAILPNCLKTEMVVTMNMREIRHFIKLRGSAAAHPDIRILAAKMLKLLQKAGLGVFVEDINM